jgi:hypothetical protein
VIESLAYSLRKNKTKRPLSIKSQKGENTEGVFCFYKKDKMKQ